MSRHRKYSRCVSHPKLIRRHCVDTGILLCTQENSRVSILHLFPDFFFRFSQLPGIVRSRFEVNVHPDILFLENFRLSKNQLQTKLRLSPLKVYDTNYHKILTVYI